MHAGCRVLPCAQSPGACATFADSAELAGHALPPRESWQAKDHPEGAVRPVYSIASAYPRLVDGNRAPAYAPVDGQVRRPRRSRPASPSMLHTDDATSLSSRRALSSCSRFPRHMA